VELLKSKLLVIRPTPQELIPSISSNRKKRKIVEWEWIEESILEQRTKLFETCGNVQGIDQCHSIMDSRFQGNFFSQNLVFLLNLKVEDHPSPYFFFWMV
jgi:hypothetical protein